MVDIRCRLVDDLKELSHKVKAVCGSAKKSVDINGGLGLISSKCQAV